MSDVNGVWYGLTDQRPSNPPRILVVGAGSRGETYSKAITHHSDGRVCAVAEPIAYKRLALGESYIWGNKGPQPGQAFEGWEDFIIYEQKRRIRAEAGENVESGVDAALICTLDEQHATIIKGLAPLKLHILCEKPLATTLRDCLGIYASMCPDENLAARPDKIFSIGHVLRYSPHNMLLRRLLLEDKAIGDILSMEHTEPVGYWHFAHSYVRGNWRKESTTAPSLLTKSCHDIDFILWLLCSPTSATGEEPSHLPAKISSAGALNYFRRARKPNAAGPATNCLSCPIESSCIYSATKIYRDRFLRKGNTRWPVKVVNPEIEDIYKSQGSENAEAQLMADLRQDYGASSAAPATVSQRPWFGRCVWESDNDVCDDQTVTVTWADDFANDKFAKSATFHMIAQTDAQCERRGRVYGTHGEIEYDSTLIRVFDFQHQTTQEYTPERVGEGHGGGDEGLIQKFIQAVEAVKNGHMQVHSAQTSFIGCTLDEILRSHALVFAAEDARKEGRVVDWAEWWKNELELFALSSEFK